MMWRLWLTYVVLLAARAKPVDALEIFSTIYNYFTDPEYCTDSYIELNLKGLKKDLETKLYGQHLVSQTLWKSVKKHLNDPDPPKPLVLSFHGSTGIGKNFAARIVIENIYKKKDKSSFVHLFNSEIHFPHQSKIETYKVQLREQVKQAVSKCGRSIFIFDEMDLMPEGLIGTLTPFLDSRSHIDRVDFRKSIFIFLSTLGGCEIEEMALKAWENGKSRGSIRLRDVQEALNSSAYNEDGGFKKSTLIKKTHVKGCVLDEMKRLNVSDPTKDDIENVLDELVWYPKGINIYSTSGCKKVSQKVALHVPDQINKCGQQ